MPRPITISDDTILVAARALFTEKGPRATTAEIAARAGVSEGILFKRFGSKAALHKAAMSSGMVAGWIQRETRAQGPLRTEADFVRFIRWQAEVLRDVVPLVMVAWSSRSHTDEVPADLTGPKPAPLVSILTLAEMLQEEMDAGHLAPRNAEAVARIVIGSIWYFVFLGVVFNRARAGIDEDTFVKDLARVVFGDVAPARGSGRTRRANQALAHRVSPLRRPR
jgi:AcrR family transcriptional regulator